MPFTNTKESLAEKQQGISVGSRVRGLPNLGKYRMMPGVVLEDKGSSWTVKFDNGDEVEVLKSKIIRANSRSCNSSNPVVRNAMATNRRMAKNAAFDDGSVLVSYNGFGSPTETQKRMPSRDFKTWLEKNGLGDKAQGIWFALMKGDDYAFMTGGTKVKVKAL